MKSSNLFVKRLKSVVLSVIVASPMLALAEAPKLKTWQGNPASLASVGGILNIQELGGKFTTDKPYSSVTLRAAFFKNGELDKQSSIACGVRSKQNRFDFGEVAVKIADLDILQLRGAPENSMRFHYAVQMGDEGVASGLKDFPKSVFDCSKGHSTSQQLDGNQQFENIIFHLTVSDSDTLIESSSLDDHLKSNPQSELVIFYLTFNE